MRTVITPVPCSVYVLGAVIDVYMMGVPLVATPTAYGTARLYTLQLYTPRARARRCPVTRRNEPLQLTTSGSKMKYTDAFGLSDQ